MYDHDLFDSLLHSITQLCHISYSSSAKVVATAGELAKDRRHQDAVEKAGCEFIPLVVETFGVWSISSLIARLAEVVLQLNKPGKICCNNFQFFNGQIMHI